MRMSWIKRVLLFLMIISTNFEIFACFFTVGFGGGGGASFGLERPSTLERMWRNDMREVSRSISYTPETPKKEVSPLIPLAVGTIGALCGNGSITYQTGDNPGIHATAGRKGKRVEAFASTDNNPQTPNIAPRVDILNEDEETLLKKQQEGARKARNFLHMQDPSNWSYRSIRFC